MTTRIEDLIAHQMGLDLPTQVTSAAGGASLFEQSAENVIPFPPTGGAKMKTSARQANVPAEELVSDSDINATRRPINLDDVARECAFVREARDTGGKDYDNHLWNLTTFISTFTTGGVMDARRMANKHPAYKERGTGDKKDGTDDLFDRKVEEKKANPALGWPQCKAIEAKGCKSCKTCPHFAEGKSPLNFGRPVPVQPDTGRTREGLDLPVQVTSRRQRLRPKWWCTSPAPKANAGRFSMRSSGPIRGCLRRAVDPDRL